jgi:tetratricopeptide (TPR) repeat protein
MIAPLLHLGRSNLASQAMGMLSGVENLEPGAMELAMARISLSGGNPLNAGAQLQKARDAMPANSPLLADREELWGDVEETLGDNALAMEHYLAAAAADPHRPGPPRRLAELYANKKAWKDASRWMEEYTKIEPSATGHELALLGDYYMAGFDLDKALATFRAVRKGESDRRRHRAVRIHDALFVRPGSRHLREAREPV